MQINIESVPWDLYFVPSTSEILWVNKTKRYTLGTCDPSTNTIYISNQLVGEKLKEVLQHELSHAYSVTVNYPISFDTDETVAQFSGLFSDEISQLAEKILEEV